MSKAEQEWKNYRTLINDHLAIISVNMEILEDFPAIKPAKVAHFSHAYEADENGLPRAEQQEAVFHHIVKSLSQLCALPDVRYAGHIISNGKVQIYFYIADSERFIETATQLVSPEEIIIQEDPEWDIYFEFLLPSSLEMKISMTEEMLDTMAGNGIDLGLLHTVEHRFHFHQREDMDEFIEQCGLKQVSFTTIKYTDAPVQLDDMENSLYLLKLAQEIRLDNQDIFNAVELFEEMSGEYHAEYIGWEYVDFDGGKKYLN